MLLQRRGRHMDCAIRFTWADGRKAAVLLVEHWSDARKVDLPRVLRYVGELVARYPDLPILPVILVADQRPFTIDGQLRIGVPGWTAIALDAHVVRLTPSAAEAPRTRVAIVLATIPASRDPVGDALRALRRLADAPGPIEHLHWLLPLVQMLFKMRPRDQQRLIEHLHRDAAMLDILAILKAEGKAEGRAEGIVASIRFRVAQDRLTIDQARAEIDALAATGALTAAEADLARSRLG